MTRSGVAEQSLTCEELVAVGGSVLEGPCWNARSGCLLFVDIPAGTIFVLDWSSRRVELISVGQAVSAVIPRRQNGEVIACRQGLATLEAGTHRMVLPIEAERQWTRTNDAKCDPAGRLWVGTMADDERSGGGSLYRVDPDWTGTKVIEDVTISNGLGWSPDGSRMYYIDSPTKAIDVLDYDADSGSATNRRTLIETSAFAGLPDGMSVDAEGCLWVAFYGGAAVRRFSPDGRLLAVVDVPTENVTSCAFAGPGLDHLVITTAASADSGRGGDVYTVRPGVRGMPTVSFAG